MLKSSFLSATLTSVSSAGLFDNLKFQNEGVVNSTDSFTRSWFSALYLECENCTKPQYSWAIKGANYLFRDGGSTKSCYESSPMEGYDRQGGDIEAKVIDGNATDCAQRCCDHSECASYVYAIAPASFKDCSKGDKCCFLKNSVPTPKQSSVEGIATGIVCKGCTADANVQPGFDRPGGDLSSAPVSGGAEACAVRCCGTAKCGGYVFVKAPGDFGSCKKGDDCCYLKDKNVTPAKSGLPGIITASVEHQNSADGPPIGMRSAVPLGGVGAGSFEIRADGAVKEITIVNQSPAGSAKQGMMDGLLFAVREGSGITKLFRTHPPSEFPANAAAASLRYQGAYPVSRLELVDPSLVHLKPSLYAFSRYRVDDLDRSTTPAVALSLEARNTGSAEQTASFLVTLPFSIEEHYARRGSGSILATSSVRTAVDCLAACQGQEACVSWMWESSQQSCTLMADAPLGAFEDNVFSGIKGVWTQQGDCLTLNRPAGGPAAGNASLCVQSGQQGSTFGTAGSTAELYTTFAESGNLPNQIVASDAYGAAAINMKVPAGGVTDLSIALSWYFPARDYMDNMIGNFYSTQYANSAEVGEDMISDLKTTVQDITSLHRPLFESTLPEWLTDTLLNSVSHVRSAWLNSKREWRQWEAYDCVNVDSIHNDGERHIPYIMFMPETTRNKMHAWGATQQSNGMLPEQLACGCMGGVDRNLDGGCGRVMSDVSSMYIVYLLELYKWSNDTASVQELWPIAKKAAQWHLDVADASGVPEKQCNTYDILGPQNHKQVSYNSAFHLLGMRAAEELAKSPAVNDPDFAAKCSDAFLRGQYTLNENQWVSRGKGQGYYSYAVEDNTSLMVDTFYPQVLSYTLGLGPLVDEARLQAHLDTELEWNDSPFGLVVQSTGAGKSLNNGVWQMGPPNWATLNIHLGGYSVMEALEQPAKSLGNWRDTLKDLWNVAGIADQSTGLPSITSHYGYFMSAWHLPLAISGQQADLPNDRLVFHPKIASPYSLPVLLPGVIGILRSPKDLAFELELTTGSLDLLQLEVKNCAHAGAAELRAGTAVTWNCLDREVKYV